MAIQSSCLYKKGKREALRHTPSKWVELERFEISGLLFACSFQDTKYDIATLLKQRTRVVNMRERFLLR